MLLIVVPSENQQHFQSPDVLKEVLLPSVRGQLHEYDAIFTEGEIITEPKPSLQAYQVVCKFLLIWKKSRDKDRFEKLCRYLVGTLESDSIKVSYIGVTLNKEHALTWISHMKDILWKCCEYLNDLRPESAADMRVVLLYLHTLVAFTSTNTWTVLKTKNMELLKPGLNQLCANIMGYLFTKGFYLTLKSLLQRGLSRSKIALKHVSLSALMTLAIRPLVSAGFTEKLMTMFVIHILSVPALVLHVQNLAPECIQVFVNHNILTKSLELLNSEQNIRIVFNTLEGNYALCLVGNLVHLAYIQKDDSLKEVFFPTFTFVISRMLESCQNYVVSKQSNLTYWHPVLGWFAQNMDYGLHEAMPSVKVQLYMLWSGCVVNVILASSIQFPSPNPILSSIQFTSPYLYLELVISSSPHYTLSRALSIPPQELVADGLQTTTVVVYAVTSASEEGCEEWGLGIPPSHKASHCPVVGHTLSELVETGPEGVSESYGGAAGTSSTSAATSSNLLRRALDHRTNKANAAKHHRKLGSPECTKVALLCSLYQTALGTLTQLRLDILTGLCYQDNILCNLWRFLCSLGPHCGLKAFLDLLAVNTKCSAPEFQMLILFSDCMTHYVTRDCRRSYTPDNHWLVKDLRMAAFFNDLEKGKKTTQMRCQKKYIYFIFLRNRIVEDGYRQLALLPPQALKGVIRVHFINEQGLDEAGIDQDGVFKERLYPSPTSYMQDNHLQLFEFVGRMLGKAVYEGIVVDVPFASFFLSQVLGQQHQALYSSMDELPSLDPELYRSLTFIKHHQGDVQDLDLTFSLDEDCMGRIVTHELVPGGRAVPVNNENKINYIHLMAHFRMHTQIKDQTAAFIKGFRAIINPEWLSLFSTPELQRLVSGDNIPLDLRDLRRHTQYYGGFHDSHRVVCWLWDILDKDFNDEEKRLFLKFVTSCSKPPLLGFAHLEPPFSIRCVEVGDDEDTGDTIGSVIRGFFTIRKKDPQNRLPTSSTCFNLLKLPNYQKKSTLRDKLRYAVSSNTGFELS
uniref:Ubiquitin-protein ligase E3B n=1 Tax=Timema californicum TaxID=61474 RepID=A0A7R9IYN6_TIMCA|nr:unnamed protein product [Timema californicum]